MSGIAMCLDQLDAFARLDISTTKNSNRRNDLQEAIRTGMDLSGRKIGRTVEIGGRRLGCRGDGELLYSPVCLAQEF